MESRVGSRMNSTAIRVQANENLNTSQAIPVVNGRLNKASHLSNYQGKQADQKQLPKIAFINESGLEKSEKKKSRNLQFRQARGGLLSQGNSLDAEPQSQQSNTDLKVHNLIKDVSKDTSSKKLCHAQDQAKMRDVIAKFN